MFAIILKQGVFSSLPVIRYFSIYAGLAIFFDMLFQATFFVAMLAFDARRQERGRAECYLGCYKLKQPKGRHCCASCSKKKYESTDPGFMDVLVGEYIPRVILTRTGKIVTIAVSLVLTALSIYGAVQLRSDFNFDWFVPNDSPAKDVIHIRNEHFTDSGDGLGSAFSVYTREAAYLRDWPALLEVSEGLRENPWVAASSVVSWFDGFHGWMQATPEGDSCRADAVLPGPGADVSEEDEQIFYGCLDRFFEEAEDGPYLRRFVQRDADGRVTSTRINAVQELTRNDSEDVAAMDAVRATTDARGDALEAFAYSFRFVYLEGSKVIRPQTLRSIVIAGVFVCIVTVVLLADVVASLIVLLHVALVDVALLAILWAAGYR